MCNSTTIEPTSHPQPATTTCHARTLGPKQRQELAIQSLAGIVPISELAEKYQVSRKFVYQQKAIAAEALAPAFQPRPDNDDKVLFHLPVTKHWLRQFALGLVLIGHCPLRAVVELFRDFFDYHISLGSVHKIVDSTVDAARQINNQQDLSAVLVGAHDEIFQNGQPVLAGLDAQTTYCYLLSLEEHRDADTWGVNLLDLRKRGLNPRIFIGDAGAGLRAGLKAVLPDVPCRSDVFHALQSIQKLSTTLENQAYRAMQTYAALERKSATKSAAKKRRNLAIDASWVSQLTQAAQAQSRAIQLADDVAWLARCLRQDILAWAGPAHPDRLALYDFILVELEARLGQASHLIRPVASYLKKQRDDLLDFAAQLDREFAALAVTAAVTPELVRKLFATQLLDADNPQRWSREASLRQVLGERHFPLCQALEGLCHRTVRASSVVENLNSRLRDYFFLRQNLGNDYLALLQFFLNHRRFSRSEHPERVNHSPTELLTGKTHPHWVELLGYTRFSRN
jgi:hypothetical protein